MNKNKLIKEILKLAEEGYEVSRQHNKMLNKYKLNELKNLKESLTLTIGLAKVQLEIIKNK